MLVVSGWAHEPREARSGVQLLHPFDRAVECIALSHHPGHQQSKDDLQPMADRMIEPIHADDEPEGKGEIPTDRAMIPLRCHFFAGTKKLDILFFRDHPLHAQK